EGDDTNDDDEETDSDRTESDIIKTLELYKDVNVNLGNENTEMTDADQGGSEQQNVSQSSGFEQVEEDAHVTLTPVLDTQKADEPIQTDNEIASLMETLACHAMAVPEITSGFTKTIPLPTLFFNPLLQQATPTQTPTTSKATTSFPSLSDFSSVFKFNDRVTNLEKDLLEIKQVDQITRSCSLKKVFISTIVYFEAAAALFEFELTKMLTDKMEKNKSYEKLLTNGSFMKSRDDKDKDQDPSVGSDRGTKRKKSSKEVESSKDSRSKENKSSSTSKDASQSKHKSFDKSAYAEEPSHTVEDSSVQQDQEFVIRENNDQPADKEVTKADWFKKPERPPTPDTDWNKR
ncbi:hypothetical protein Tco_1413389, partial [Tanacetum coccineum]